MKISLINKLCIMMLVMCLLLGFFCLRVHYLENVMNEDCKGSFDVNNTCPCNPDRTIDKNHLDVNFSLNQSSLP
jgi:hypothetical protein